MVDMTWEYSKSDARQTDKESKRRGCQTEISDLPVDKNAPASIQAGLDKFNCSRDMFQEILVINIIHIDTVVVIRPERLIRLIDP